MRLVEKYKNMIFRVKDNGKVYPNMFDCGRMANPYGYSNSYIIPKKYLKMYSSGLYPNNNDICIILDIIADTTIRSHNNYDHGEKIYLVKSLDNYVYAIEDIGLEAI